MENKGISVHMPVYDKLVAMKLVESETMNSVVERILKFVDENGGM